MDITLNKNRNSELPKDLVILFVAAQPSDSLPIQLDNEYKKIQQVVQEGERNITLHSSWATTAQDLTESLLRYKPHIVIVSSHAGVDGIELEREDGTKRIIRPSSIGRLFQVLKDRLQCVILNGCKTNKSAELVAKHIDYVVGISSDIKDESAIAFIVSFIRGITFHKTIEESYNIGLLQLEIDELSEVSAIILYKMFEDALQKEDDDYNLGVW